uniref:Secreted phosphoprotein 1 n=1 Tax=Electrophorus electricus TaxID=8005 RepID=A0A4W4GPC3_ELEEL
MICNQFQTQPPPVLRKAPAKAAQAVPVHVSAQHQGYTLFYYLADTDSSESAETTETEATSAPPLTMEPTQTPAVDSGRGDSMGYPVDYKKTIIYMDGIEKGPSHYQTYGSNKIDGKNNISKKTPLYDGQDANNVEKHLKALQVNNEVLEEEMSTPEETQGLEATRGIEDEEPSNKQADLDGNGASPPKPEESKSDGASASSTNSESASGSTSQEEEMEEESDSNPSSKEFTAATGAADESDSSQSSESQESDSAEQTLEATSDKKSSNNFLSWCYVTCLNCM